MNALNGVGGEYITKCGTFSYWSLPSKLNTMGIPAPGTMLLATEETLGRTISAGDLIRTSVTWERPADLNIDAATVVDITMQHPSALRSQEILQRGTRILATQVLQRGHKFSNTK